MSDPWENKLPKVRMNNAVMIADQRWAFYPDGVKDLRADANALLAVVREFGDGGDLETIADLLQEATNEHGVDQGFDGNPYFLSDLLRCMAQALAALPEHLK